MAAPENILHDTSVSQVLSGTQLSLAGGGSSGGGSSGGGSSYSGATYYATSGNNDGSGSQDAGSFMVAVLFMVTVAAIAMWSSHRKRKAMRSRATKLLAAHNLDYDSVVNQISDVIKRYNRDWSDFRASEFSSYMTPKYCQHAKLLLSILESLKRRNVVDIKNVSVNISDISDQGGELRIQTTCDVFYNETLVFEPEQKLLSSVSNATTSQQYGFVIRKGKMLLDSIYPVQYSFDSQPISKFAELHGAYYQPDMGNLFLPTDAEMFSGISFGAADINNHVVGVFGELADSQSKWADPNMIYQIYTCDKTANNTVVERKVVGQLALPRRLGRIIVVDKKGLVSDFANKFKFKISNYEKVELESSEFNKLYDIYVTPSDRLSLLEVLNPKIMQFMVDNPDKYNLEVTDNTIYAYINVSPKDRDAEQNYAGLLQFLQTAHGELRM